MYFRLILIATLTLVSGAVAGTLHHRWREPADLAAVAQALKLMPDRCGDWQLQAETPMDGDLLKLLSCAAHVNRSYRNRVTGDTVNIFVVLGPPGPIAVHTPEVCFDAQNYRLETTAEKVELSPLAANRQHDRVDSSAGTTSGAQFWRTTFVPSASASQHRLIAYYAWTVSGPWEAPKQPRIAFGGEPYLYKVQASSIVETHRGRDADPCKDFIEAWLAACAKTGFMNGK
jgi:hypothetical protein